MFSTRLLGLTLATAWWALQGAVPPPATPRDAAEGVLAAFQAHAIVAMADGRGHGDEVGLAFRLALVQNPALLAAVDDIVLEAGNARFQATIDRYVRG